MEKLRPELVESRTMSSGGTASRWRIWQGAEILCEAELADPATQEGAWQVYVRPQRERAYEVGYRRTDFKFPDELPIETAGMSYSPTGTS